jgi:SAM-dependent methyltransferase
MGFDKFLNSANYSSVSPIKTTYSLSNSDKVHINSKWLPIGFPSMVEWKVTLACRKGGKKSAYIVLLFLDEQEHEVNRRIKYVDDFSGNPKQYVLRAKTPLKTKYVIMGYRVNTEGAELSENIIDFPDIDACTFDLVDGSTEIYDGMFDYEEAWKKIDLEKDYWTIVGPKSKELYDKASKHKKESLVNWGLKPNSSLLDIGCGTGLLLRNLENYFVSPNNYVGMDLAQEAIDYCKQHFPQFQFYKNSISGVPNINKKFDIIVLFSVFTHIYPNEMESMLKQLKSFLKPNGFIVSDVHLSSAYDTFSGTRDRIEVNEKYFYKLVTSIGYDVEMLLGGDGHQSPFKIWLK